MTTPTIALLYPGDAAARERADLAASRFADIAAAFAGAQARPVAAVYHDDVAEAVAAQLQTVDAVLVWCNPIESGRRRDRLDALLRSVAAAGVYVSTHPDVIMQLGTKDVLVATRDLEFGSDARRVETLAQLNAELPSRLDHGARVLKQHRGHSGIGVWRVEWADRGSRPPTVRLQHAQRGAEQETVSWPVLLERMAVYFAADHGGHMVDQAWQPRLADGMVRAYLVGDRVVGFGHQAINALFPTPAGAATVQPGPRLYSGPDEPAFQLLRRRLSEGWIEQLRVATGVAAGGLPLLWDCDFLIGDAPPGAPTRYVLCEVNVSSVAPYPPSAVGPLVAATLERVRSRAGGRAPPPATSC